MKINEIIFERLDARDDLQLAKMQDAERAKVAGKLPGSDKIATLIGKNSDAWDPASNARAEKLEKRKMSPIAIWQATGNWRGPEGEWRQEVSDHALEIKKDFSGSGKLKDFIDHKELEKAYPGIMDLQVKFVDDNDGEGWAGYWNLNKKTIVVAKGSKKIDWKATTDQMLETLAHEWQHVIQDLYEPEFTKGSAPSARSSQEISKSVTKHNKSSPMWQKIIEPTSFKWGQNNDNFTPHDSYTSTGGERTATMNADRLKMTPVDRIMNYPGNDLYGKPVTIPGDKIPDNAYGHNISRPDGDIPMTSVTNKHKKTPRFAHGGDEKQSITYTSKDGKFDWE